MEDDVHKLIAYAAYSQQHIPSEYNQRWLDFLLTLPRRMSAKEAMELWGKFKNA
jgi:hypothetical protein